MAAAEGGEGSPIADGGRATAAAAPGFGRSSCLTRAGLKSTSETLRDSLLSLMLLLAVLAPPPSVMLFSEERSNAPARRMVAFAPCKNEPSIAQQRRQSCSRTYTYKAVGRLSQVFVRENVKYEIYEKCKKRFPNKKGFSQ